MDMTLEPGEEESLGVVSYFSHYDDDVLTYTASSATESVAMVSMDESRLTVAAVAVGESEVTVTATDSKGEIGQQYFKVTVEISD
ncbi:MAG: Ig-like domain-containing protein [Gemmatimonadetes bacterium]|nr:Ig-like domain-containing protein [Gemmatimonadota bacterium]